VAKSSVHVLRKSYSAPGTKKFGAREERETLSQFLLRIRQTEKMIPVSHGGRLIPLADATHDVWVANVIRLWGESQ
jgi:hypothetical protein